MSFRRSVFRSDHSCTDSRTHSNHEKMHLCIQAQLTQR